MNEDEQRKILTREWETRLALKQAKARLFLDHVSRGTSPPKAWQQIALDTADLEREHEEANVEKYLLWLTAQAVPPPGEAP